MIAERHEKRIDWRGDNYTQTAYNDKNEQLGFLSLEIVGRHTHWCWRQFEDIRMSPGCLQEVRDKQKELFKKYRSLSGDKKRKGEKK